MRLTAGFIPPSISVSITTPTVNVTTGTPIARDFVERDPYTGEYTVTPSGEVQILSTRNLRMTDNVTVNPVPSNYGRIEWNGQYLVVS